MSPTLFQMPFLRPRSIKPLITIKTFVRQSSSSTLPLDQLEADLRKELKKRIWTTQHDYLSPTPSQLLNISLADFFPDSCYPRSFNKNDLNIPPESKKSLILPQGHHLVYFPPLIPDSNLLPDGTDPLHSPGPPFVRRMWAGGSLQFNFSQTRQFIANGMSVYMQEGISDVSIKGTEGAEKVFVTIKRGYNKMQHQKPIDFIQHATIARRKNLPAILETRNLVFMREKSKEAAEEDAARPGKILKPTHTPDFSVYITPTANLLFRFSALTFNAHRIHLDEQYCREVEGHRNLLVHGPLSLVLMLSVLRSQLAQGEMVLQFDYRNLAPLYAQEEMRICVKRDTEKRSKFDVWIEGKEGGYAVKGTAVIANVEYETN